MSFSLNTITGTLEAATSWRNNLRPSSFRGVPFYVDTAAGAGGRRLVTHQFALRDTPSIEDLGRSANSYKIRAWVVGDGYLQNSIDLISACQDYATSAVFVHPWRGEIQCRAGLIGWTESKDQGGYCALDIDFVVDTGGLPSPTTQIDTASQLLTGIASLLQLGIAAYEQASLMAQYPALLIPFVGGLLDGVSDALLGLPSGVIGALGGAVAAILTDPGDDADTATAVQAVFQGAADAAVTYLTPPAPTDDPVLGLPPDLAPVADLSAGLAGLTAWGDTLATPASAILAGQFQAIQSLVQGNALMAVLTVYAQIDWPDSQAATAARTQVLDLIDTQLDLTAALGQDDLYRGWQTVSGQAAQDLIARAQAVPEQLTFELQASRPSLTLAYLWYQDATRADQLALLNDVPDPMFMPYSGVRLAS